MIIPRKHTAWTRRINPIDPRFQTLAVVADEAPFFRRGNIGGVIRASAWRG
jgi:hypothetical protein